MHWYRYFTAVVRMLRTMCAFCSVLAMQILYNVAIFRTIMPTCVLWQPALDLPSLTLLSWLEFSRFKQVNSACAFFITSKHKIDYDFGCGFLFFFYFSCVWFCVKWKYNFDFIPFMFFIFIFFLPFRVQLYHQIMIFKLC